MQHINILFILFQIHQQTHLESTGEDGAFNFKVCWCPSQASTQHINILFCLFRYTNKVTLSPRTKTGSSTLRSASTLTSFTGFNATYEYLVQSFLNIPTNSASVRGSTLRSVSSLTSFPGFNATYEYLFNLFQIHQHTLSPRAKTAPSPSFTTGSFPSLTWQGGENIFAVKNIITDFEPGRCSGLDGDTIDKGDWSEESSWEDEGELHMETWDMEWVSFFKVLYVYANVLTPPLLLC